MNVRSIISVHVLSIVFTVAYLQRLNIVVIKLLFEFTW